MNEVIRIKRFMDLAKRDDATVSTNNWEASRGIWEYLDKNKDVTQLTLAEQLECSNQHVSFMKKCWQVFVIDIGLQVTSMADLGSFYAAYNSEEVRGKSARNNPRNQRKRKEQEQEDKSVQGMVKKAAELINVIAENPAFWQLLTREDIGLLGDARMDLYTILDGHKADQRD